MVKQMTLNGVEYPITDKFAQEISNLSTLNFKGEVVESSRLTLMKISNMRRLSKEERALLESLTHVKNVGNAIKFAANRPLSDFGFEGWDQVHGNRCTHECGCSTQYIFDHHKARAGEPHDLHPHHHHDVCDDHAHLAGDFRAHFKTLHSGS